MTYAKSEIIKAIERYVAKCGGAWSSWYVGIAADPEERLFSDHNVRQDGDAWIYLPAHSSTAARDVESYLIDVHGAQGGPGGGSGATCAVYAYRVAGHTVE